MASQVSTRTTHYPEQTKILEDAQNEWFAGAKDWICPRNPMTKYREINFVPEQVENFLGWCSYNYFSTIQGGVYYQDQETRQTVETVFGNLTRISDRPHLAYQVRVIKSNALNAWCLPGGRIAINRGLLAAIKNEVNRFDIEDDISFEDKVAAVLSHEIAHANGRHSAIAMQFKMVLFTILKVISVVMHSIFRQQNAHDEYICGPEILADMIDVFANKIFTLGALHGSRKMELEADRFGMLYMERAGYNPKAALWLHKFLEKENPDFGVGIVDWLFESCSSHPRSSQRTQKSLKNLADLANRSNINA